MMLIALLFVALQAQAQAPSAAPPVALQMSMRLSIAKVDTPPPATTSPYAAFGPLLAQMLTPEGPVDITYQVSGDGMRAQVEGRLATLPRGTILLQRVGEESMRVLNPQQKTWYELPQARNVGALLGTPDIEIQPVNERATIAGQRADRFHFTERLQVPALEGVTLPPDFPRELTFTGDLWSTDAFAGDAYRAVFRTLQAFAAVPGLDALTANGRFPLRLRMQSDFMPGYEVRTEVTSVKTGAPDAALFTIPTDYQKIVAPGGG